MTLAARFTRPARAQGNRPPARPASARSSDVIIVGGGLQGLSSAVHLARRGVSVRLLEAEYCGRHSSGVNAGGVRTLGRHVAEIPLSLAARDRIWHHMEEFAGHDGGFVPSGQLQVCETDADVAAAKARIAELEALGYTHETWADQATVRELVPSMSHHVLGGIWVKDDGYAYPYHVVTAFRASAERAGAEILEQQRVTRLWHEAGVWHVQTQRGTYEAPIVINTAGAWAGELAEQVGDPVPLLADGLMLMVTQRVAPFVEPVLGAMGRPLSFKQYANGTVVIGGSLRCEADPVGRHAIVDMATMRNSAITVTDLFPHLRNMQVVRAWAGVEGFLPDQIPVIGPSVASPGVFHAFGFSAHGFELSPIIGEIMADLVEHGESRLPIHPFRVNRFTQQENT
ncbi:NAD(P)/FAD-dependent oxidoreductase [Yanghanlia caeni]|uniref:FAD-dependent oxidoreductase n=1 Tax=Yanghanlia caeni TaxID=3064283 RepID=A0ABU1D4K8_9BURK|nr:FAD-dependent oxidoreductase [Alcaligenaceae bacterium LG-2]HZH55608.1 FAD-dependent oxidoreductase [Burkholderiaceae bacterium]